MDTRKEDDSRDDALAPTTRWNRRKAKIREEIERNRRGEYKVPTWVLTLILLAFVCLWIWAITSA